MTESVAVSCIMPKSQTPLDAHGPLPLDSLIPPGMREAPSGVIFQLDVSAALLRLVSTLTFQEDDARMGVEWGLPCTLNRDITS